MIGLSQTKPGFSLIEIMVAILIVAVMGAIGFGAFRYLARAKVTRTEMALQAAKLAIGTFQSDTGEVPTALSDLIARPGNATVAKRWRGPYLEREEDLQDAWYQEFQYQRNAKNPSRPYELYSWGPNGEGSPDEEHISVWN